MSALIVGTVRAWVTLPDGTVQEDSILVTADELGVCLAGATWVATVTPDVGAELADVVAEAVASSRTLAREAKAGREWALIRHAERVVADALPGIELP